MFYLTPATTRFVENFNWRFCLALHLAASEGHYEAAELLISMKASVNIIDR